MSQKRPQVPNLQTGFAPRIYPIGWVLKYDPPVVGLLYRRNLKEKKKHLYQIHLNNLIFLSSAEDITRQIFYEHPQFLNPQFIKPDQVLHLVMKLLEYKQQRLREMAEFMEEYEENGHDVEEQIIQGDYQEEYEEGENDEEEIDYNNLTEEQMYQLYQHQLQMQAEQQKKKSQVPPQNKQFPPKGNDLNKSF